jgi:beta-glucuronidase
LTEELLENKRNTIQVCVNITRTSDRVPMRNTDWYNWSGLYRDIELIRVPEVFIKDFKIQFVPDDSFAGIKINVTISDDKADGTLRVTIPELNIDEKLSVKNGKCEQVINAEPELWSPESPKLYDVFIHYGEDNISDRVGFRQINVKGTDLYLNGKKYFSEVPAVMKTTKISGKPPISKIFEENINMQKNWDAIS